LPSPDADLGLLDPVWAGRPVASATSDSAIVAAMVRFEVALAAVTAPAGTAERIAAAGAEVDVARIAVAARDGGNPVIPLLADLRSRLSPVDGGWLHRGATSQDALDSALVLVARHAVDLTVADARAAALALSGHADAHRGTVIPGRTLTQAATPTTLGLKIAGWAWSLGRAARALSDAALSAPVQLGGAAGTLAALAASGADPTQVAADVARQLNLARPVAP
jgi:3-carboxy-cis,cis-muconate cycloisomerase